MTTAHTPVGEIFHRRIALGDRVRAGTDAKFPATLSTERPVPRWFGVEILDHSKNAVDLDRARTGLNLLLNHDPDQIIGRVERVRIDGDRLRGDLRFFSTEAGRDAGTMVEEGLNEVSVGYRVSDATLESTSADNGDTWRVTRWELLEVSLVAVPADAGAGIGRSLEDNLSHMGTRTMNIPNERPSRSERRAGTDNRDDAAEIARLANKHGYSHRAEGWLASGLSAVEVSREILELRAAAQAAPMSGISTRELLGDRPARGSPDLPRGYSLRNAILSSVDGGNSLEREWSDDYARQSGRTPRRDGVFVHPAALFQRALDSITPTKASEIVFDRPGELIELLRPIAQVIASGARVMSSLVGPVPFPKQVGAVAATWVQENPASDVAESTPLFGTVTLAPKTLQGFVQFSRQLLVQSSLNVEAMVRTELATAHGLAIDRAALHGSGAGNEPLGIFKTPDVNSVAIGGVPTYAKMIDMLAAVAADNAITPSAKFAFLMTSGLSTTLMKTLEFASSGSRATWTGTLLEGLVAGYRAAATNQLSATMNGVEPTGGTSHGLVFGNWNELLIGLWGALELVVDPYTQARKGMIGVTSFQMCDIAARHGESFCLGTGATP